MVSSRENTQPSSYGTQVFSLVGKGDLQTPSLYLDHIIRYMQPPNPEERKKKTSVQQSMDILFIMSYQSE